MGIKRHRALLDQQSPARRVENLETFELCWLETYQYALLNPYMVSSPFAMASDVDEGQVAAIYPAC